jgi:hypothetical protein
MKASTFIVIILLGVGVYVFIGGKKQNSTETSTTTTPTTAASPGAPAPTAPVPAAPGQATLIPPPGERTTWTKDELWIVRGIVTEIRPDGIVLNCDQPPPVADFGSSRLNPTGGNAAQQNQVALASDAEKKQFGELMMMENGTLRVATWAPKDSAGGMVILRGAPASSGFAVGRGLKVIAAPYTASDFTLTYKVQAGARSTLLDRK